MLGSSLWDSGILYLYCGEPHILRLTAIFILNLPSATKICISVSACHSKINKRLLLHSAIRGKLFGSLFLFKFLLFSVTIKNGGKPERPDIWNDRTYGTTGHMEQTDIWNDRTYGTVGKI